LIDYTPEIKAKALELAKQCRMGPYFIPGSTTDGSSKLPCSWYAPGASGGVNIDGGTAADPETGRIFVGGQTGLTVIRIQKDPCSEFRYSSVHNSCGQAGALPTPPGYTGQGAGGAGAGAGTGAAPGAARGAGGGGGGFGGGRNVPSTIGGVSILKPKDMGGITSYDMNTGDKTWWIPNGGFNPVTSTDPMFAGIKLPPVGAGGQPNVINTKTLMIYGTGRQGGARGDAPQLFAVDKATGKQVGALKIPSKTTAVPMTFMHEGQQYIVFATGSINTTQLIALSLKGNGGRGRAGGGGGGGQ
jgi:quinoprotein glucose dehydrogenase